MLPLHLYCSLWFKVHILRFRWNNHQSRLWRQVKKKKNKVNFIHLTQKDQTSQSNLFKTLRIWWFCQQNEHQKILSREAWAWDNFKSIYPSLQNAFQRQPDHKATRESRNYRESQRRQIYHRAHFEWHKVTPNTTKRQKGYKWHTKAKHKYSSRVQIMNKICNK